MKQPPQPLPTPIKWIVVIMIGTFALMLYMHQQTRTISPETVAVTEVAEPVTNGILLEANATVGFDKHGTNITNIIRN